MADTGIFHEQFISPKEALKFFAQRPTRRTLTMWMSQGLRVKAAGGKTRIVILESFKDGGRRFTTLEAIERFRIALNGAVRKRVKPRKANGS